MLIRCRHSRSLLVARSLMTGSLLTVERMSFSVDIKIKTSQMILDKSVFQTCPTCVTGSVIFVCESNEIIGIREEIIPLKCLVATESAVSTPQPHVWVSLVSIFTICHRMICVWKFFVRVIKHNIRTTFTHSPHQSKT